MASTGAGLGAFMEKAMGMRTGFLAAVLLLVVALPSSAGESRLMAAVLSAIVPGAGQAYLGWRTSAEVSLLTEGAIWGGRYYMERRSHGIEDEYIAYAAQHAGSYPLCRDEIYYADVGEYWNSERANQHYQDPYRYVGDKAWQWSSSSEMRAFNSLLTDRRDWDSRAKNITALAILNRAVSVVYCLRAHRDASQSPVALTLVPGMVAVRIRW